MAYDAAPIQPAKRNLTPARSRAPPHADALLRDIAQRADWTGRADLGMGEVLAILEMHRPPLRP